MYVHSEYDSDKSLQPFNTLRSDKYLQCKIVFDSNSLKIVSNVPIDDMSPLIRIRACCRIGDRPLTEPIMIQFTHAYMRPTTSSCELKQVPKELLMILYTNSVVGNA